VPRFAPLEFVFAILTDSSQKTSYTPGLRMVRQDTPITRVHTAHRCVFDEFEIRFQTEHASGTRESVRYVERVSTPASVELIFDYALVLAGGSTRVTLRISSPERGRALSRRLLKAASLLRGRISAGRGLSALKAHVEGRYQEERAADSAGIASAHR